MAIFYVIFYQRKNFILLLFLLCNQTHMFVLYVESKHKNIVMAKVWNHIYQECWYCVWLYGFVGYMCLYGAIHQQPAYLAIISISVFSSRYYCYCCLVCRSWLFFSSNQIIYDLQELLCLNKNNQSDNRKPQTVYIK